MKKPDEYQIIGADFLSKRKWAVIGDEMGLGKTGQLILAANDILAEKILVICPAIARIGWQREWDEFSYSPGNFKVIETYQDSTAHNRLIVSFDFVRDNLEKLTNRQWDLVIVDECHTIKEPTAQITKAVYGKNGLVRFTNRMWLSSGTSAPNNYAELWPILFTFGLTNLSYWSFANRYCIIRRENNGYGYSARIVASKIDMAEEIRAMLEKVMIARPISILKDTPNELPPLTTEIMYIEPSPVDFAMYASTFNDSLAPIELTKSKLLKESNAIQEALDKDEAEGSTIYLEQAFDSVATVRRYNGLSKMPNFIKVVGKELASNQYEKVVIFAFHKDVIDNVREGLKHFGAVTLYGGTAPKKRQRNIDRFMADPSCRVIICNIKAAATALTLTSANEVIMLEWMFSPADNNQAIRRVWRRTQQLPVRCRFATCTGTIDEAITKVFRRKQDEIAELFKDGINNEPTKS